MINRSAILATVLALMAGVAVAQTPAAGAGVAAGAKINAELRSKLDTRHAKVGDRVRAVTTSDFKENGKTVLPKGSTITGHVTEVGKAANAHSASRIGVLFDQAVSKRGQRIPLRAGIASVFTSSARAAAAANNGMGNGIDGGMGMGGGGMMGGGMAAPAGGGMLGGGGLGAGLGGAVGAAGPVGNVAAGATGAVMGSAGAAVPGGMAMAGHGAGAADVASNGVPVHIAMPAVAGGAGAMSAAGHNAGADADMGSVLSTSGGNMQFDAGTRMQLQVIGEGGSAGASASGRAASSAH